MVRYVGDCIVTGQGVVRHVAEYSVTGQGAVIYWEDICVIR